MNIRSIRNKTDSVVDHVIDSKLDILALTETWLKPDDIDQAIISQLSIPF